MTIEIAIILTIAGISCFYGAAEYEARDGGRHHGILWAGLSSLISVVLLFELGSGLLPWLLAQAGLFVGIGLMRVWLEDWRNRH
jgi:hypothetical protein